MSKILYQLQVFVFLFYFLSSCNCSAKKIDGGYEDPLGFSDEAIDIDLRRYLIKDNYIISDTIDLKGKTFELPPNITLLMKKGVFKNGILVGNNTVLKCGSRATIFNRVHIKGSWIISKVRSSMFSDLSYDNSLKDVIALTNPSIYNNVYIQEGNYYVTARYSSDACLLLNSNTKLRMEGNIALTPNAFSHYSIIQIEGSNIEISGRGIVQGDKDIHKGNVGEWGMGIYVNGGSNIKIANITIKDCWGDCIYITKGSKQVEVNKCRLNNGRRQGISIISAENVLIRDCVIMNVGGTNPEYAIDIEPNKNDTVGNVIIKRVKISNCRGGISSYGKADNSDIGTVFLNDVSINRFEKCPIGFVCTKNVFIDRCSIEGTNESEIFYGDEIDSLKMTNVSYNGKRLKYYTNSSNRINVRNTKSIVVK